MMNIGPSNAERSPVPFIALVPFLLITFGLAWGILAMFILWPAPLVMLFGEVSGQHPLFILAVWSPAIAAFSVIIYLRALAAGAAT